MSKLPSMKYEDKIKKTTQVAFGGLRHSLSCGDGELYDMKNLTCREYPILQPREQRMIALQGNNSSSTRYPGIYADNGAIWYVQLLSFTSGGHRMILRSTAWSGAANVYISEDVHEVKMVRFGNRLILMPDKIVVKTQYKIEGTLSSKSDFPVLTEAEKGQIRSLQEGLKQKLYQWTGTEWKYIDELYTRMETTFTLSGVVKIEDGTVYGEKATANALSFTHFSGYSEGYGLTQDLLDAIHIGDGLEISGLTEAPGNDKTAVVTGVRESGLGGVLFFSDNCFKMPLGEDGEPVKEVTIEGTVTLKRSVPDMDFCFEHDNRLWGAKGKTIYASKLGDPNNWNVFEGLSTDAWSLATQKKGELTGGVSYGGYPTFFREDAMVRIYGATPQTFQVSEIAMPGVKTGEHESIAAAGGMLLYLSREGMMIYADEYPVSQTSVFGTGKIEHVMACSDGTRYYAQMTVDGERAIYCYDSKHGLWMKEDDQNLFCMTYDQGTIYGLIKIDEQGGNGVIDLIGDGGMFSPATQETAAVESFAEFGDFTAGTLNRKAMSKLQLRMELEEGASVQISIRYDGGAWKPLWTLAAGKKRSVQIPILPTRCDYYRIKITGTGMWRLYAMAREQYEGSEIH